jgi:AcrR family transcriptional regulator
LDGAQEAFCERGYHAATVHDICARAGVGIGTFYAHFDDKGQLLKQLMTDRAITLPRLLKAADFADAATLSQKLYEAVDEPVAAGMWRAWHEATLVQDDIAQFHIQWRGKSLKELATLIEEARRANITRGRQHLVDPSIAAWAVMSLAREFTIHDREYRPDVNALASLLQTVVFGVANGSRPPADG